MLFILYALLQKRCFSCQQKPTFEEDFSSHLGWLSVTVRALLPSKAPFSNPPKVCGTLCWPPNCRWLVTVLPQGNVELHFDLMFTPYFNGGWRRECGKVVEIDDSCFSRQKCNCSRLCTTVWVFVGVEQELGHLSCACHRSLHWDIAIIKACILPSTTIASDCWGYNVHLRNDGLTHNSLKRSVSFVACGCSQIRSRPHGCTSRLTSGLTEKTKIYVW
jgi:hypothetical protein